MSKELASEKTDSQLLVFEEKGEQKNRDGQGKKKDSTNSSLHARFDPRPNARLDYLQDVL